MAGCLIFQIQKVEGCTIRVAKIKALVSFVVTVKLICVFVFAYTKLRFSHDTAQLKNLQQLVHCRQGSIYNVNHDSETFTIYT